MAFNQIQTLLLAIPFVLIIIMVINTASKDSKGTPIQEEKSFSSPVRELTKPQFIAGVDEEQDLSTFESYINRTEAYACCDANGVPQTCRSACGAYELGPVDGLMLKNMCPQECLSMMDRAIYCFTNGYPLGTECCEAEGLPEECLFACSRLQPDTFIQQFPIVGMYCFSGTNREILMKCRGNAWKLKKRGWKIVDDWSKQFVFANLPPICI